MFHKSMLGVFGERIPCDEDGHVPEYGDNPWDWQFRFYHYGNRTHHDDGSLTEYGEWWLEQWWPRLLSEAAAATEEALRGLEAWRPGRRERRAKRRTGRRRAAQSGFRRS